MIKKHLKLFVAGSLALAVTLAFASQNNFHLNFADWGRDAKEITKEEADKRIRKKIVTPIFDMIKKNNPHMFMTKCFVQIDYDIWGKKLEDLDFKIYDNSRISGSVILDDCGRNEVICKYEINLATGEAKVRESFFRPWESVEAFLKRNTEEPDPNEIPVIDAPDNTGGSYN